jgi:type I restriction enzyme S subunit
MATNQGFKSFVPNPDKLDTNYLYHWLRANRTYLESLGNGATFKELSKAIVSRIQLPLPSLDEQRRIALILDQADDLRRKRRHTLERLDHLLHGNFLDLFGNTISNERNFQTACLGDLCDVRDGTHDTPKYV